MTASTVSAWIVAAIRNGTNRALSASINFCSKLPILDAALLAAVIGGLLGLVSGALP